MHANFPEEANLAKVMIFVNFGQHSQLFKQLQHDPTFCHHRQRRQVSEEELSGEHAGEYTKQVGVAIVDSVLHTSLSSSINPPAPDLHIVRRMLLCLLM